MKRSGCGCVVGGLVREAAVGAEEMAEAADKPVRVHSRGSLQRRVAEVPKAPKLRSYRYVRSRSCRAGLAGWDQACSLASR
jgi:hypothetical protein